LPALAEMDQEHYFAFIREEANPKTLLADSRITEEERGIALAMMEFYEDPRMNAGLLRRHQRIWFRPEQMSFSGTNSTRRTKKLLPAGRREPRDIRSTSLRSYRSSEQRTS